MEVDGRVAEVRRDGVQKSGLSVVLSPVFAPPYLIEDNFRNQHPRPWTS